jgi:hypothetical protein
MDGNREDTTRSDWLRALLIVVLLAAPALLQRLASHFIDDPYLQPLALTVEGLASSGEPTGDGSYIHVQVDWGRGYGGPATRDGLRRVIEQSLGHRTTRFYLDFRDRPGDRIGVSFVVGANAYGPYAPSGMARGIDAAFMALKMEADARKLKYAF